MADVVHPLFGSNSLPALIADIRLHHEAAERAAEEGLKANQSKLEHSIEAGKALIDAKARVTAAGGKWMRWLEINFSFAARTAAVYMKIATNAERIRSGAANVTSATIRGALKVIAGSAVEAERQKAPRTISDSHKDAVRTATTGRIRAKRKKPGSEPIKQNFIPNIPGYLEEMLLTMERCVVEYDITPVDATAKAIIAHRIKIEHFDEIIDWLTQLKRMVHQTPEETNGHKDKA